MRNPAPSQRFCRSLALAAGLILSCVCRVLAETNREAWFYAAGQTDLGSDWTGTAAIVARYSDALGGLSDRFVELQAARDLSDSWQVVPSFRVNHAKTSSGLRRRELQPGLSLIWRKRAAAWALQVRSRLEYREFDASADGWRFRFRIRAGIPVPEGSRWRPYISSETFHDKGDRLIDEHRMFVGTTCGFSALWTGELFLGWRHRPNAIVLENSVIGGLGLRARF